MKKLFASLALAAAVAPVWAATQTVTLSVPGMTCASCPITVKHALSKVEGVSKTDVSFDKRQAVVTFDDDTAAQSALAEALGRGPVHSFGPIVRPLSDYYREVTR